MDFAGLLCEDNDGTICGYRSIIDYMTIIGLVYDERLPDEEFDEAIEVIREQDFDLFKQIFDVAIGLKGYGLNVFWNPEAREAYNRYRDDIAAGLAPGVRHRMVLRAMYADGWRVAVRGKIIAILQFMGNFDIDLDGLEVMMPLPP